MIIPKSFAQVVPLLADAADGANKYGTIIGLKQNTEDVIRAAYVALVGKPAGPNNVPPAVPGLMALWNAAKANKCAQTAALRTAISNGRALAMTVVASLKPALGRSWNSSWNAVGFAAGSLAVPDNPATLLLAMRAYYAANPTREVADVNGTACTAAACQAAAEVIAAADTASNKSNTDAGTAQANLQDGITAARNILSGLHGELGQLLDNEDPRWLAFGFDQPGHAGTPDVPQNLTVTAGTAGSRTLYAHCDDARRADGYRFTVTNAADNSELAGDLTQDAEDTFNNLPAGTKVLVTVTARNATGESLPCAPVTIVVP